MRSERVIGAVPIKPFRAAKQRLQEVLTSEARAAISQELAARTIATLQKAGATPLVLAADEEVAEWGFDLGLEVILDLGSDLNTAAGLAVAEANRRGWPWLVLHVDLPMLARDIVSHAVDLVMRGQPVIAPSSDGGNPLLGSDRPHFRFAYGPGSFQRHLRLLADENPVVLVDPTLAVDLDGPDDLRALRRHVQWLAEMTDTLPPS